MSAALHLAKTDDLDRIAALAAAFNAETGIGQDETARRAALEPLLAGIPHGAVYLIGPARAPMGYAVIAFGWSIEFGGLDAILDEIYLRPAVRGRGIASETLETLARALAGAGVKALHLEVERRDDAALRLYTRAGFHVRDGYMFMSKRL